MNIQSYYSAGYYTAELDEPDWHPRMNMWGQDWYPEIEKWCQTTFGKSDLWGEVPVTGWKSMRNKFFFAEEKQLEWFILRWS